MQLHRTGPNSAVRDGLKLEITPMAADGRVVEHTGHFCRGWDENAVCLGCCNYTPRPMSTTHAYFLPARRLEVHDQGAGSWGSDEGPVPAWQTAVLLLSSHGLFLCAQACGEGQFAGVPSYKGTDSIRVVPLS